MLPTLAQGPRVVKATSPLPSKPRRPPSRCALAAAVPWTRCRAAAAVAAHECGHAVQHAKAYAPLKLRSALVPIQNISATILNTIFTLMFFGFFFFQGNSGYSQIALLVIVLAYAVFTLVAFVTLPVEINASQRALAWLANAGVTNYNNHSSNINFFKTTLSIRTF